MSGDVQPRKRKDKRRRRDDDEGSAAAQSVPLVRTGSTDHSDNVTIHVYKEAGTGGHWCARIIFFALLAGLLGVVGLIILEHRGTGDVDTPVTSSQWAMIFEGWVDEAPAQHDDEHEVAKDEEHEESHEESHEEDEGHGSEHQDEDEEDEGVATEEDDDDAEECSKPDEEVEEPGADKTISEEETDEGLGDDVDVDDDDGDDEPEPQDDDDDADEGPEADADESRPDDEESDNDEREDDYASPEKDDEDEDRVGNEDTDEDEGYSKEDFDDETDDLGALEEVEDDDVNDDDAEAENVVDTAFDSDLDFSIEGIRAAADEDHEFQSFTEDDDAEEYISIPGVNDIDDNSAEPLEEIDGEDPEEVVNEVNNEEEDEEEEKAEQILEEESTSVAMKFGVGIALIVTAHFVLVRRWNNGDADAPEILTNSDEVPNLSRRNTLVPPGRIKEDNLKNNDQKTPLNKEQEQTYEDLHTTYKTAVSQDKKGPDVENIFSKKTSDLQAILFGGSKDTKAAENTERLTDEDNYSEDENDYEDDEEYDEEDMEEDYEDEVEGDEGEEEEEEEEDNEDVEDVEDVDDTELVEKLDKKYGKLPTPPYSDQEDEEDEEEDEDEDEEEEIDGDEEEDDELDGWKRVKAPTNQVMGKSKESESKPKSGGQQGEDYLDDSLEDLRITEETNSISSKVPDF